MSEEEIKQRLETEPDFIALRRYQNSLARLEERYPDGCPDHVIAAALGITEEEVQERHEEIIETLRIKMRTNEE